MTRKRFAGVLSLTALLVLGGAAWAQLPTTSRPYNPFGKRKGRSDPRAGIAPGQPGVPKNPVSHPNVQGGHSGVVPRTRPRNPVPPTRPARDDRDRGAPSPGMAAKLAEGVISGLSHVRPSGGPSRPTVRQPPRVPTGFKGGAWWKSGTSSTRGRGWLASLGAGIAAVFGALFGRRKGESDRT
jgi:hypothetical protein